MYATMEKHLAKKYYEKLFREYCISDLRYYKENKGSLYVVIRDVQKLRDSVAGRFYGVHISLTNEFCDFEDSFELTFFARLCPDCSYKLNYKKQ
ncbi:Protein FRA10AC1 [Acropora cervicornis]|uniref:Protein FRA10AC1 n=1 Tax=Acropora cervicornis TaxID=6130 RepID=A0AAD9QE40_ACRCE|nr:Protein FRA10AC1 [Acropora cervicornis]